MSQIYAAIADDIRRVTAGRVSILASQLGQAIRDSALSAGIDLPRPLPEGGVYGFAEKHLRGIVRPDMQTPGGPYLRFLVIHDQGGAAGDDESRSGSWRRLSCENPELWNALSNPKIGGKIAVSENGSAWFSDDLSVTAPDGMDEIKAFRFFEYRQAMAEFCAHSNACQDSGAISSEAEQAIGVADEKLGQSWYEFVKSQQIVPAWESFRVQRVTDFYSAQISKLRGPAVASAFVNCIYASREFRKPTTASPVKKSVRKAVPLVTNPASARSLLERAIPYLSEEVMCNISIPLGVVVRILSDSNRFE